MTLKQKKYIYFFFAVALITKGITLKKNLNTNEMKPNISKYILFTISHGGCLLELFWKFWHDP